MPAERVSAVEALLTLAGAESIALEDAGDTPLLEPPPGGAPLWPRVVLRATFGYEVGTGSLESLLAASLPAGTALAVEDVDENAWRAAALARVNPRRFGSELWLVPAEGECPPGSRACVRLNMGLAFGTGEHPTTALCLEWLDAHGTEASIVLDYGCGSGVLALAALVLGAERAYAVNVEPQALAATAANAELNGCAGQLWIGAPEALPDCQVDLVLANILAGPLTEHAARFARCLRPGGRVVLSGVLSTQRDAVLGAYARDFEDLETAERDGWLRIAGRRRN